MKFHIDEPNSFTWPEAGEEHALKGGRPMTETSTFLTFLLRNDDDATDALTRRSCLAMLTANSRRTKDVNDEDQAQLLTAWMLAYMGLRSIHEHVRPYTFVTEIFGDPHATSSFTFNASGQLVERSGSMRQIIPADRALEVAGAQIARAEQLLAEFEERHPTPHNNAFVDDGFAAYGDPPVTFLIFGDTPAALKQGAFSLRITDGEGVVGIERTWGIRMKPGMFMSGEGGIPEFQPGANVDPAAIGLQVGCGIRAQVVHRLDEVPDAIRQILADTVAAYEGDGNTSATKPNK